MRSATKGKKSPLFFQQLVRFTQIILAIVVMSSGIFLFTQFDASRYFPIKTVNVYGTNRTDHQVVQDMVQPLVNHGFFTVNLEDIKDRLTQMPWVADAFVRRLWPNAVAITVVEREPAALWNDKALLSTTGELFSPPQATYPAGLPHVTAPEGKQSLVLQHYNEINRLLLPLHAKITYLELTPSLLWKVRLNSGMTLHVGHKDVLTRIDHFVKVYPKIIGDNTAKVEYVDLRYANGVAVRWKTKT